LRSLIAPYGLQIFTKKTILDKTSTQISTVAPLNNEKNDQFLATPLPIAYGENLYPPPGQAASFTMRSSVLKLAHPI
jgi:hypothetical protein